MRWYLLKGRRLWSRAVACSALKKRQFSGDQGYGARSDSASNQWFEGQKCCLQGRSFAMR